MVMAMLTIIVLILNFICFIYQFYVTPLAVLLGITAV